MYQRKIQLIAGTTYSVSLPKEWIKNNNLKEKNSVTIKIKDDRSLNIFPSKFQDKKVSNKFELNIDQYGQNISQVLFSLYYAGFEDITLFSEKAIEDKIKNLIKKTLINMSGTEIIYEDSRKIQLKVLLDINKLDIKQIFFRIALIISSSIDAVKENNIKTIRLNEDEIDRLYHLIAKIIFLSSLNQDMLKNSNITYSSHIMPYFLIAKKLENIADSINNMANFLQKNEDRKNSLNVLKFIAKDVKRSINYLVSKHDIMFEKTDKAKVSRLGKKISKIKEINIKIFLTSSLRYLFDIEEEMVNISFYDALNKKEIL